MADAIIMMRDVGIVVDNFDDSFDWKCHLPNNCVKDDDEDDELDFEDVDVEIQDHT